MNGNDTNHHEVLEKKKKLCQLHNLSIEDSWVNYGEVDVSVSHLPGSVF